MVNNFSQFVTCPLMNMHNVYRYSGVKLSEPESLSTHIVDVQIMGYMILDHLNNVCGEDLDPGLYLEKCLHHDLEECLTGDVSRPLKYHNPKVLKELKDVAYHTATGLYTKYFENSIEMMKLWEQAKDGKEGVLLKVVDMLCVANKALREIDLLNNNYFLKVAFEVRNYLEETLNYFKVNSPYNKKATEYLLSIINEAIISVRTVYNDRIDVVENYRILDTTLLE